MTFQIRNDKLEKYEGRDTHVAVPEGIVSIADYAFYGAADMKQITLPSSLKEIGSNAFYDCEALEEVQMPDGVAYIGSALFSRCHGLKKVSLSDALTSLPKILFYQCDALEEIQFPRNLKKISRACFQQAHGLKNVLLPDSVEVIEENAFDDCTGLEQIHLPAHLKTLGNNVFYQCSSLKELNLPESLVNIGTGAFETRGRLRLIVPEGLHIHPKMLDNNWNMYWNFGSNGRYNGKNEENYNLVRSVIPDVTLREWKPAARCILCINYLESGSTGNPEYDSWIKDNHAVLLDTCLKEKRYDALYAGCKRNAFPPESISNALMHIQDPAVKAKIMALDHAKEESLEDLFDLL